MQAQKIKSFLSTTASAATLVTASRAAGNTGHAAPKQGYPGIVSLLKAALLAMVSALYATASSAAWILDSAGTTLSNETWTLSVAAMTVGGEAGLKVTGWTAGTNDLDLSGTPKKVYDVSGAFASTGITSLKAPDTISYGANVFKSCTALTNATLSAGVKTIGASAFSGCTALTAVGPTEFPELSSLGNNAFDGSTLLEQDFSLPVLTALNHYVFRSTRATSIIASNVTWTGDSACKFCAVLKRVVLSPDLTTLTVYSFYECRELEELLPTNFVKCTKLDGNVFRDCNKLRGNFSFPGITAVQAHTFLRAGITSFSGTNSLSVGDNTFGSCPNLTRVELSPAATKFDIYAFQYCGNLETLVPQTLTNLTTVNSRAFYECKKLRGDFSFPALGTVGVNAFRDTALNSINIPKCVTLNESCFKYCSQLTNAVVGATSFGVDCFASCPSLSNLTVNAVGAVAFGARAVQTTPPGLKIWYNCGTAPTSIGANALQPADANRYATIVVKPDSDYAGWEALCARTKSAGTLTPADMAREDYPQKRVIGLIVNGSNRAWVVRGAALGTLLGLR